MARDEDDEDDGDSVFFFTAREDSNLWNEIRAGLRKHPRGISVTIQARWTPIGQDPAESPYRMTATTRVTKKTHPDDFFAWFYATGRAMLQRAYKRYRADEDLDDTSPPGVFEFMGASIRG